MEILKKDNQKLQEIKAEIENRKAIIEDVENEIVVTKKMLVELKQEKQTLLLKGLGALQTVASNTVKINKLEIKLEQLVQMDVELKLEFKNFLELELNKLLLENKARRTQECSMLQVEQLQKAFEFNNAIWKCYDNADQINAEYHYLLNDIESIAMENDLDLEHRAVSVLKYRHIPEALITFGELTEYSFNGKTPHYKYKDV